ncbi:MAG: hypothetical protein KKE11_04890 [Gammaproteobacteria bacterium]|nr:hypothetical protein [Gammaproteobacteria bacterium]
MQKVLAKEIKDITGGMGCTCNCNYPYLAIFTVTNAYACQVVCYEHGTSMQCCTENK